MNSKKIKITLFEDKFGWGGIETFIYNICSNIDLNKYDITIVTVTKVSSHFDSMLSDLNIKMDILLSEVELNPIKRLKKGIFAFYKYLNEHDSDIIHFNVSNSIDLLYVYIAKKYGMKACIAHSHNSSATSKIKVAAHYISKIFLSHLPDYYFACSDAAAKWLFPSEIYKNREYYFIRNAIDMSQYSFDLNLRNYIRKRENWDKYIVFGEVGRFNLQKNHKFLIEVFSEIVKKKDNAILVLVGTGELENEIQEYTKLKKLEKKVIFYGTSGEIPNLLQAFDVFMLPSLYEGLPFVLVESQAASLPALVSDTITSEIGLTKYVEFLPLNASISCWADKAIECAQIDRNEDIEGLYQAGFNLPNMIEKLDSIYSSIYEEKYEK